MTDRPSLEGLDTEPEPAHWCCNGNAEDCPLCTAPNPPYPFLCPGHDDTEENRQQAAAATEPELTADEARALVDELGTELYRAQDALAFVGECCDIADREQRAITTADVREWLKGARCGRQLAADAQAASEAAEPAPWSKLEARAFNAVQPALREAGEWLPFPPAARSPKRFSPRFSAPCPTEPRPSDQTSGRVNFPGRTFSPQPHPNRPGECMTERFTPQNVTVTTATIEVKTLTLGRRQITQSVFRQLVEEQLVEEDGTFRGQPWGYVNHCPDKKIPADDLSGRMIDCATSGDHRHVVWQKNDELRRSRVSRHIAAFYGFSSDAADDVVQAAYCGNDHKLPDWISTRSAREWRFKHDGMTCDAINLSQRYQSGHTCPPFGALDRARAILTDEVAAEKELVAAQRAVWKAVTELPQLFIAV